MNTMTEAFTIAVQRAVTVAMGQNAIDVDRLTLRDIPAGREKAALMRERFALGLSMCPNSRVIVDHGRKS